MKLVNYKFLENLMFALIIIATSLSFGLGYGIGNQNIYLIDGLVKLNPDFLPGDWFAHATVPHHDQFAKVIWFVNYLGLPLGIGLTGIEIFLRILALAAVYKIMQLISHKHTAISFLVILSIIVIEKTSSVAGSYIFSTYLQPSSFGKVFTLIGFLYFLRGNYLISGVCIAFAGYMHTNFLLLGFILLSIAHLFLGKNGFVKRIGLQFVPMMLVFGMELPFLLRIMSSENGPLATHIIQFIRSPHHYVPNTFLHSFFLFSGWSLLGLATLNVIQLDPHFRKRLLGLYSALLLVIVVATLLTTIIFIPLVSQFFFWRMAPFSVLFSQILFVTAAIEYALSKDHVKINHLGLRLVALFIGSLFIIKWYSIHYASYSTQFMLLCLGFVTFLAMPFLGRMINPEVLGSKVSGYASKACCIGFVLLVLVIEYHNSFYRASTLINGFPYKEQSELYSWTKNAPTTAIFLTPPNMQNFRLHGERAVVVDWKSIPVDPDGAVEWYRRIEDVSGRKNIKSAKEANEGYLTLDIERLEYLQNKYGISFAVLYRGKNNPIGDFPVVFENKTFSVISLEKL